MKSTNLQNGINIISGEGEGGTSAVYTGARTGRALKCRLTKERRGGRWAKAVVYSHEPACGAGPSVGIDFETGSYCNF